jgi:hypothetical protein
MKTEQDFDRIFRQEFRDLMPNTIFQNDDGSYEVFGHYRIISEKFGYRVFCSATDVGNFGSTRTALSWCIADKYKNFNLARTILETDNKLNTLTNDINTRASLADRSRRVEFRDTVEIKLESKIINKKKLENQLNKCVTWAKYCQQRGFINETARTGRSQSNKTNR